MFFSQDMVASIKEFIKVMDSYDQDDEEEAKETANLIIKNSRTLTDSIKIITESVIKKDQTLFVATTRTMVPLMNELLQIDQKFDIGLYWASLVHFSEQIF